jgi:hypothetical protein
VATAGGRISRLVLGTLLAAATGCGGADPTTTGAACPTPDPLTLTWDNFGQAFMTRYCTACHASDLPRSQRNGAPIYHDFDTLIGVLQVNVHVDQYAGAGPAATNTFMPPERCPATPGGPIAIDCPRPSLAERTDLSVWLVCERDRDHPVDAGVD